MVLFNPDQILNIYTLPTGETLTLPAIIGQVITIFDYLCHEFYPNTCQFLNTLPSSTGYDESLVVDIDALMNMILESDVKLPENVPTSGTKRKRDECMISNFFKILKNILMF